MEDLNEVSSLLEELINYLNIYVKTDRGKFYVKRLQDVLDSIKKEMEG